MNPVVQILGWALIHALWQDSLLVLLAALGGLFLRDHARHRAHGLALGLCLLVPLATAWHAYHPAPVESGLGLMDLRSLETAATDLPRLAAVSMPLWGRWEAYVEPRLPILVLLWAVGASLMALRLGGGYALSLRWKRQGTPAPAEWQRSLDALALRLGLRRPVGLMLTARGSTPMVIGFWKPMVLFPVAVFTNLPSDYLEALLAHELAHVRRLDVLSNLFQGVVETLLFFHPAIWWLSARIRAEREELADQLAAKTLGEPRRLALALNALDDLQPVLPQHPFPVLAARGGHLRTRIQRLLSPRPSARAHWSLLTLLLVPCTVLALRAAVPAPSPIPVPAGAVARLDALAAQEGVDPQLLRSMAWVESGFDPSATSSTGARGLLQVMPETARAFGAKDLNDRDQVTAAGVKYLRFLLDRYHGDTQKAVAAYNCGEKALDGGHITEEATRYRALVMDVLAAKAVQPETPLAEGEVQGVIRRLSGDRLSVQFRTSQRGNLKVDLLPVGDAKPLGTMTFGAKNPDGTYTVGPWAEARPRILLRAPKPGTTLLIRCEEPGLGWRGEARVMLEGPWNTFRCQMVKPKP